MTEAALDPGPGAPEQVARIVEGERAQRVLERTPGEPATRLRLTRINRDHREVVHVHALRPRLERELPSLVKDAPRDPRFLARLPQRRLVEALSSFDVSFREDPV
jgi:hypothetical protein